MISIVGTRVAAAVALLVALIAGYFVLGDLFPILVGALLLAAPILSWMAFWFFARRAVLPDAPFTLRVRVQDALALALASSVAGILGLIVVGRALNAIPPVDRGVFLVGLSFALLMVTGPAVNWLLIWQPWKPD